MKYSIVDLNEVKNDNEIFRYDADYFHPSALEIIKHIKEKDHFIIENFFSVTKLAGFEYTEYFTPQNMASDNYYIALTSKNIQNEELNIQEFITIDKNIADNCLKRSKLLQEDVILSYTGEYRRALTLQQTNFQLGPNICLLRPKKNCNKSYYLSVFLNSNTGQMILDREKTLSAQPTVAMSRIRKIPVPECSCNFADTIKKVIKLKYELKQKSENLFLNSKKLLSEELNLVNYNPNHQLSYVKNFSDTQKEQRIDAEYFQPKYENIIEHIKKYINGFDTLSNLVNIKDKNVIPKAQEQYRYIELANITNTGEITDCISDYGNNLPSRARRLASKNDIITSSIEGSLESIALITDEYDNSLCSTGFYILTSNFYNPETLFCLMKSNFVQAQLKKGCSGTILTAITKDELNKIILPKIKNNIQEKIQKNIKEMYNLSLSAKKLLEFSKRTIEISIEENETAAINWLNDKLNETGIKL